jgi:hypothetical protein
MSALTLHPIAIRSRWLSNACSILFRGLSPSGFEPKATLYASHCTDDSPLFVAAWYTMATALVTAVGALAGAKLLRY